MDFPTDLYFLDARNRTRNARAETISTKGGDAYDKSPKILKRMSHEITIVKTVGRGKQRSRRGVGVWEVGHAILGFV